MPSLGRELSVALCSGPWSLHAIALRLAQHEGFLVAHREHLRVAMTLVAAYPDGVDADTLAADGWPDITGLADRAVVAPHAFERPLAQYVDLSFLADRLDVSPDELEALARWRRRTVDVGPPRTQHYHYSTRAVRGGGIRVVEAPKQRLKEVQRRVLRRVLAPLAVHPDAYGSVPGRGVVTAVEALADAPVIVALDMERWFTSITAARVAGWLRRAGAADGVAHLIALLCTNVVPPTLRRSLPPLIGPAGSDQTWWRDRQLATHHLPQGAPTSPRLADLIASRLDRRLAALAAREGMVYRRYVDDLFLAGSPSGDPRALLELAKTIVRTERFGVSTTKCRVQRSSGRQLALGAVVNDHATLPRAERDRLRAIVHNCRTRGWRSQVRDGEPELFRARLTGKLSWLAALDPVRGRRLLAELDAVDWN